MNTNRKIVFLLWVVLLWGSAARLLAQDKRIVSATGRFVALCPPEMDATYLVVWAEDVVERLEKLLGDSFSVTRGEALYLIVGEGEGIISYEQYYDEFGRRQKLFVSGIEQADQEYLLECLCQLMLNRKTGGRQVPFWFAAGAAQNLFPEARIRNNDTAVAEWSAELAPDFTEVITQISPEIPDVINRAFFGQAVAALLEWMKASAQREKFFAMCAAGAEMNAQTVAELAGFDSVRDLEATWDVWLASRQRVRAVGTGSPRKDAARLRAGLELTPEMVQLVAGRDVPGDISFGRMIRDLEEAWVPAVAGYLGAKLESNALGCAPVTQPVVQAWRDFLRALAVREEEPPWYSMRQTGRKNERQLRGMLNRARTLLDALENSPAAGE